MRKLLIVSLLTIVAASANGCMSRNNCNPCGGSSGWQPGYYLFGWGRQNQSYAPYASECCDPCMHSTPVMTAPCCQ